MYVYMRMHMYFICWDDSQGPCRPYVRALNKTFKRISVTFLSNNSTWHLVEFDSLLPCNDCI